MRSFSYWIYSCKLIQYNPISSTRLILVLLVEVFPLPHFYLLRQTNDLHLKFRCISLLIHDLDVL
jgi:hypothetical protein